MAIKRDSQNNLYDNNGKTIGKVGYDGVVRDGFHDRGQVTKDEKYLDEYGRDQGWIRSGGGEDGDGVGCAFTAMLGLIAIPVMALIDWINADPKRKRIAKKVLFVWLGAVLLLIALPFLVNSISEIISWIINLPGAIFTSIDSILKIIR